MAYTKVFNLKGF